VRDDYLREFIHYWRTKYDWKAQEKMMNQFNHFKTNIEGINVHFIHEKPEHLPKNVEVLICDVISDIRYYCMEARLFGTTTLALSVLLWPILEQTFLASVSQT